MKIYDISQEVFSCAVYPGDPAPERRTVCAISQGDVCNLTAFSMCAHNGTHIDAPAHFIADGKTVEQLSLDRLVGPCYVAEWAGELDGEGMRALFERARAYKPDAAHRLLLKGQAVLTAEAAEVLAEAGVALIGVESQTVGPQDAPMAVHRILLGAEVVILEGLRLTEVAEGGYLLSAAPLCLGGSDGAPCRALLLELD